MTGWPEVREVQVSTVPVHGVSVRTTVSQNEDQTEDQLIFSRDLAEDCQSRG